MLSPFSPDQARLAAIREALPATGAGIYLNTATAGPLPAETARAMADLAAVEASTGRAHPQDPLETLDRIGEARAALAAVLASDLGSTAITRGTAHGLALALTALAPGADDRVIVVKDHSEPASGWPLAPASATRPAVIEVVAGINEDPAMLEGAIRQAFQAGPGRVRALVVPLVTGWTGVRLPVERLGVIARSAGAAVIADGGNAVGAVPTDPVTLGVDALALPAERWLLGPAGLGGLWCGPGMLDRIRTIHPIGFGDGLGPVPDAAWLAETASWPRPAISGMARSAGWLAMQVGLPWAWERTSRLVAGTIGALRGIPGVTVLTPADQAAAIVSFRIAGWLADDALAELGARSFLIAAASAALDAVRLSLGAWTSEAEVDRLLDAVRLLATHDRATLPPRRTLNVLP